MRGLVGLISPLSERSPARRSRAQRRARPAALSASITAGSERVAPEVDGLSPWRSTARR